MSSSAVPAALAHQDCSGSDPQPANLHQCMFDQFPCKVAKGAIKNIQKCNYYEYHVSRIHTDSRI